MDSTSIHIHDDDGIIHHNPMPARDSSTGAADSTASIDLNPRGLTEENHLHQYLREKKLDICPLLQWVTFILILVAFITTCNMKKWKEYPLRKLPLLSWELMLLAVIGWRLLTSWAVRSLIYFIRRNTDWQKRSLYYVYVVKTNLVNFVWFSLIILVWHFIIDKNTESKLAKGKAYHPIQFLTDTLMCCEVLTVTWSLQNLLTKALEMCFNVVNYLDRIRDSLFIHYVIEILLGSPKNTKRLHKSHRIGIPRYYNALSRKEVLGDDGIKVEDLVKLNSDNISGWTMKTLINIISHEAVSVLDQDLYDSGKDYDEPRTKIRSEFEAGEVAERLFHNITTSSCVTLEDLESFLPEEYAIKVKNLLEEASESNRIDEKCVKKFVVDAYKERVAIVLTLHDREAILWKLHLVVMGLVGALVLVIWLMIFRISTKWFATIVIPSVVSGKFLYGKICSGYFDAFKWLYLTHRLEVGDVVMIDGVQMVVEEMYLSHTVFLKQDGSKVLLANSDLYKMEIRKCYPKPDRGDAVEFFIDGATPVKNIRIMKQQINSFIVDVKYWHINPTIVCNNAENLNRVRIAIWLTNTANKEEIVKRQSQLVQKISDILTELRVQHDLLPVKVGAQTLPPFSFYRLPPSWMRGSS